MQASGERGKKLSPQQHADLQNEVSQAMADVNQGKKGTDNAATKAAKAIKASLTAAPDTKPNKPKAKAKGKAKAKAKAKTLRASGSKVAHEEDSQLEGKSDDEGNEELEEVEEVSEEPEEETKQPAKRKRNNTPSARGAKAKKEAESKKKEAQPKKKAGKGDMCM